VLQETDFYPGWKKDPDGAVESLRRKVEVRLEGELAGGPPSLLFVVEVRGPDRAKVIKAADLIPRAYAEVTRQVLQDQAKNLRDVLDRQLRDLSGRLTEEEAKLVAFKVKHAAEMPEGNEANLRAAATLATQMDLRMAALADARRRRSALFDALPEPNSGAGMAGADSEDTLRRLEAARAAYGPENPDVKRMERHYREASGRSAEELRRFRSERVDAQLARLDGEIREERAALGSLASEQARVQKRLEAAPGLGEQYRVLARDYETLRAKYTSTTARAVDARAAQELLAADAPELFRVIQPAAAPSRPATPNRKDLALVALAVALGAAALTIAAAEYFDSSLRGAQDAGTFGVPVLASIPRIGGRRAAVPR